MKFDDGIDSPIYPLLHCHNLKIYLRNVDEITSATMHHSIRPSLPENNRLDFVYKGDQFSVIKNSFVKD